MSQGWSARKDKAASSRSAIVMVGWVGEPLAATVSLSRMRPAASRSLAINKRSSFPVGVTELLMYIRPLIIDNYAPNPGCRRTIQLPLEIHGTSRTSSATFVFQFLQNQTAAQSKIKPHNFQQSNKNATRPGEDRGGGVPMTSLVMSCRGNCSIFASKSTSQEGY